jgi:hypothetical protein
MSTVQPQKLQDNIAAELARLAQLGPLLKGTLSAIKRTKRARGAKTQAAHLLTYKGRSNKTKSVYIPANRLAEARAMIGRHRQAKRTLDTVVDLSVHLFKAK